MGKTLLLKKISLLLFVVLNSFLAKAQLTADFNASAITGCAPLAVSFTNTSTGGAVSYSWNDGNGNTFTIPNPGTTYLTAGVYNVTLTVTNATGGTSVKTKTITVVAKPTVTFSASPLSGCSPLNAVFTNTSVSGSGSVTNYLWDFGDGTSSTLPNPPHLYSTAGINNVTLQVTNSAGCINTLTKPNYINVTSAVNASFFYTPPTGCGFPQTITFTNNSTGISGVMNYLWDFGDGTTSTAISPTHTFTAAGTYTIKLTATNASGCTSTYIHAAPVIIGNVTANFTTPPINCVNNGITFTNTSSPLPVSAAWDFGDGTTSTAISPVKTFTTAGAYTVTLVSNFGGCQATKIQSVTIQPKPTASFTPSNLLACNAPHTVNFTNSSVGATSYLWNFGDGNTSTNTNPTNTYNAVGVYGITLIATNTNGCSDTLRFADSVRIKKPVITIGNLPAQGCAPLTANLTALVNGITPILSYEWQLGDGTASTAQNPTHIYAAGTYDVQLVVKSAIGCSDTVKVISGVKASTKPIPNFTASPLTTCAIFPVNFTDLSTGVNSNSIYSWVFGDGTIGAGANPSHQYEDTGTFSINLIVENAGCFDSIRFNNYVHINSPVAKFNVIADCSTSRFTKAFNNTSIDADTNFWEFGDGTTSTAVNPTHTYATVGTYTVKLTVHNNTTGCDFYKFTDIIVSNEIPNFTASLTEMCKGSSTVFTATSINNPSGITDYYWNYGDGILDTTNVRTHSYTATGSYNVQLIIKDLNGCRDTLVRPNYIKVYGPAIAFGSNVPGACLNGDITFTDQTITDGIHPITNWTWNYGDGTAINPTGTASVTHMYTNTGLYPVTLTVKDSYGCSETLVKSNFVTISLPVANFGTFPLSTCLNQPVAFTDSSTGPGLTYLWNFGDGNTSTAANPNHQFAADGLYTITLTITDVYGCTATKVKNNLITVNTPVASFTVSDTLATCSQLNVQFANTTPNTVSQLWDFGDGNTSSLPNPGHFYASPGTFVAKLTATTVGGCTTIKTKNIVIRGPQGIFVYNPLIGCNQITVNFVSNTVDRISFIWDFNDGTILSTSDSMPTHTYTNPGSYVPKMILVGSSSGCTVPITGLDTIKVLGVTGSFVPNISKLCSSGDVTFTPTTSSNDPIVSYAWTYGDGASGTAQTPTHFYSNTGIYNPTLTITTQAGCTKNIVSPVPIRVVANPQITIAQPPLVCVPQNLNLIGSLSVPDTSVIAWLWTLPNGTNATTASVNNFPINVAGVTNVSLSATNSTGCIGNASITFTANAKPNIDAGNDITICKGTGLPLTATGGVSYIWSPAAGLNTTTGATVIATPDSVKNYTVTGTSAVGCVNTDIVKVSVKYPFKMQKSNGDTLCVGESGRLSASGAYTYNWYQNNFATAQGLNSTTAATVIANPTTTTTYAVVGIDDRNCFKDTAYYLVKVYPIPTLIAGANKSINVGQTTTLTPTFSSDVTSITWAPSTWVVSSTYPSITVKPNLDQQYTVTAQNPGGCTSKATVNVYVLCDGSNFFIPNTFSPNNDGVNDKFFPRGSGLFTIKQLRIFNRWGEEVYARYSFKANEEANGWDGKRNGQAMASDAYVYMIEIQCLNNTTLVYKGNVTLVK
jgi:gliding motility-associated-like protein